MGNIILNTDFTIRTTKINGETHLEESLFYVPKIFNAFSVYISLTDGDKNSDIFPLVFNGFVSNHKTYRVDCSKELKIKSGPCKLAFLIIDIESANCRASNYLDIDLKLDKYNLLHQTYISRKLGTHISDVYDKILKLTNMNIEILEKIQMEVNTDDN